MPGLNGRWSSAVGIITIRNDFRLRSGGSDEEKVEILGVSWISNERKR